MEEFQKRNTDCVYFLASPLTCKKGLECDYRHSDLARLNPRDCWYWLAGNCLNPTCAFRHPPLDGHGQASFEATSMKKIDAPCYFFFNGFCNKGDHCSFTHGSDDSALTLKPPKAISAVPDTLRFDSKPSAGSGKVAVPIETHPNPSETPPVAQQKEVIQKPVSKHDAPLPIPLLKGKEAPVVVSESPLQAEGFAQNTSLFCSDESSDLEVDKCGEPEERWESSPGFDVLVDGRSDTVDYPDERDYLNSPFLGYDFEGQLEYDPNHSVAEDMYEQYDCISNGHGSDYEMLDSMLDKMPSHAGVAEEGRHCRDLRYHLTKRREFDYSSIKSLFGRGDVSHLIKERPWRPDLSQLHGHGQRSEGRRRGKRQRITSEVSKKAEKKKSAGSGMIMAGDFEGPKPLSEILREKKRVRSVVERSTNRSDA